MMYLTGVPSLPGIDEQGKIIPSKINWGFFPARKWEEGLEEGLTVSICFSSLNMLQRFEALRGARRIFEERNIDWIRHGKEAWTLDLDEIKEEFKDNPELSSIGWLKGKVRIEPEFRFDEREVFGKRNYDNIVSFCIIKESIRRQVMPLEPPVEISKSLEKFRDDFPDSERVGFIIMQFGQTETHKRIIDSIKKTLSDCGITAIRADEKQYHNNLYENVLTYLHGCGFAIVLFERLESDDFNPNVSLEVGYLLAMDKPVCLLKDMTLKLLHTDIVGFLYKAFDPQSPEGTIPPVLTKWMLDKGIIEEAEEKAIEAETKQEALVYLRKLQFPLHRAIEDSDYYLVEPLIEAGANINGSNDMDETPLHFALKYSGMPIKIIELLISKGASVNKRARGVDTPLSLSIRTGRIELVRLLLSNGAKIDNTALSWAEHSVKLGHPEILDFLHQQSATE